MIQELSVSAALHRWHRFSPSVLLGLFALIAPSAIGAPWPMRLLVAALVLPMVLLFDRSRRFRHVALLDSCLVISDGRTTVHVPLGDVEDVSQSLSSPQFITLFLREPCELGERIKFVPNEIGSFPPWRESGFLRSLRQLYAESKTTVCPHADVRREP